MCTVRASACDRGCVRIQRKAALVRANVAAPALFACRAGIDLHVVSQPGDHVSTVPADRSSAMRSPLRKAADGCQAQQQPSWATRKARDFARAKESAQIWKWLIDPAR